MKHIRNYPACQDVVLDIPQLSSKLSLALKTLDNKCDKVRAPQHWGISSHIHHAKDTWILIFPIFFIIAFEDLTLYYQQN